MRVLAGLGVALAAAVVVPVAAAKEDPRVIELCGPSRCVTVQGRTAVDAVRPSERTTVDEPPALAPYLAVGPHGRLYHGRLFYVPAAGMLAAALRAQTMTGESDVVWYRVGDDERRLLEAAARGLEPHPTPTIASVRIGRRMLTASGAASYEQLWRVRGEPVAAASAPSSWVELDVRSAAPSPWTLERPELLYAPRANVLERGRSLVRLPDRLAADLEAGRPLGDSGGGAAVPWPAGVVLLVAGVAAWRRNRNGAGGVGASTRKEL